MDGCFSVYVLKTTEALFLFFRQRNLEGGRSRDRGGAPGRNPSERDDNKSRTRVAQRRVSYCRTA